MNRDKLKLRAGNVRNLTHYVAMQLHAMFPNGGIGQDVEMMMAVMPRALERMRPILGAVRAFEPDIFNHFNSLQYATLLYLLGNEHWRADTSSLIADRLFCLNKALSAMDLFHGVEMPEVFFISHGVGAVIGNATYGNRLVFFQNVTVGRVGDHRPTIGENVVLFPGVTITGRSKIGNNSVVTAGASLHGISVPDNVVVMRSGTEFVFRPLKRDYSGLYLRPHTSPN
jgi:serine O-acetyltransferase